MKRIKIIMTIGLILIALLGVRFGYLGKQSSEMDPQLGLESQKLKRCPDKPNCVVSFYVEDSEHFVEPLEIDTFSLDQIKEIIKNNSGEIIKSEENYLHAIFKTKIFGFVDDVEFYFDGNKLYFRSSSRVGYSDMGVNRKRIELIKYELGKLFPKYR